MYVAGEGVGDSFRGSVLCWGRVGADRGHVVYLWAPTHYLRTSLTLGLWFAKEKSVIYLI